MHQQIKTMLDLQDSMNTKVNSDWRAQNFEWYRAIWIECAELLDHYGWKWWKKQQPDIDQIAFSPEKNIVCIKSIGLIDL